MTILFESNHYFSRKVVIKKFDITLKK